MATARRTRSQERVFQCLQSLEQEISAQDLFAELRDRNQGMGLATVYRALDALKLEGVVQMRTLASGESLYSTLKQDRHHLTCLQCGVSQPLDDCPVHAFEQALNASRRFKIYYHTLEFFGLCNACQAEDEPVPEGDRPPCACTGPCNHGSSSSVLSETAPRVRLSEPLYS